MDPSHPLMDKIVNSIPTGGGSVVPPEKSGGLVETLERLFLGRPGSVVQLMLFHGEQLVYQNIYDPVAGRAFKDPLVSSRQYGAVHGVLDFMRDTFPGGGNCASYRIGRWWVVGVVEGDYTLVAMTQSAAAPEIVEQWLEALARQLPPEWDLALAGALSHA